MKAPVLTRLLDRTVDVVATADVPPDPFERADLRDAALRLGHTVMALAIRIVEIERAEREPYAPPDGTPDPDEPPPDPPETQPPPDRGGQR